MDLTLPVNQGKRMSLFTSIDDSAAARTLSAYLDYFAHHAEVGRVKSRSHELLAVNSGEKVLDVGCGNGNDIAHLAATVTRNGIVVGVDVSAKILDIAKDRLSRTVAVQLIRAQAHQLPFRDNSFDRARSERLLIHHPRPECVVTEITRVTRPGGCVVFAEPDLAGLNLFHPRQHLTDEMITAFCQRNFTTPDAGRALPDLLRRVRLVDVRVEKHTLNCDYDLADILLEFHSCAGWAHTRSLVSRSEAVGWLTQLMALNSEGAFVCMVPIFVAVGVKPNSGPGKGD